LRGGAECYYAKQAVVRALGPRQQGFPDVIRKNAVGGEPDSRLTCDGVRWRLIVKGFGVRPIIVDESEKHAQDDALVWVALGHARADARETAIAHLAAFLPDPLPPEAMPDIPTVADFVSGYEASQWYGIGAPKNTPAEIIDKLNKEINAGLSKPRQYRHRGGCACAGRWLYAPGSRPNASDECDAL